MFICQRYFDFEINDFLFLLLAEIFSLFSTIEKHEKQLNFSLREQVYLAFQSYYNGFECINSVSIIKSTTHSYKLV